MKFRTKLSSKERLLRAVRRQAYDCPPCSPRLFNWLSGNYGSDDWVAQAQAKKEFGHDPIIEVNWADFVPNLFHRSPDLGSDMPGLSVEIKSQAGQDSTEVTRIIHTPEGDLKEVRVVGHPGTVHGSTPDPFFKEHLIKEPSDLPRVKYLMPPEGKNYYQGIGTIIDLVGEQGLVEAAAFEGPGGYLLSDLLGPENAFILAMDNEPFLLDCLTFFNGCHQRLMKQALESGAQMILDGWWTISLGSGWGLNHWRKFALPFIRENIALVHGYQGFYHYYDDGKMAGTLPYAVEAGADVVETLSPPPLGDVDLKDTWKSFNGKTCLKGNIDQVNLIWRGTPETVRKAVFEALEITGGKTGFILSTADSIRPESPKENVAAYFNAWREYCRI